MASSAGIGPDRSGGGGANASAYRSTGYVCRSDGDRRPSQAFLYGVNTLNGRPACESTSSRSKITWSFAVRNEIPRSASACAMAVSRSQATGS